MNINGLCDKADKSKKSTLKVTSHKACAVEVQYKSKDACIAAALPLQKYMKKIAPFTGAILIIGGLLCTFAGSKFVPIAISFLTFLAGSGGIFMIGYNFLPPTKVSMGSIIALLVIAVLIGICIGYLTYRFAQAWAVPILGGWLGIVVGMLVLKLAGVKNQNVVLGVCLVAAVGVAFISNKFKSGIKKIGTAFIGAFITVRGIGSYAGGFPSELSSSAGKYKDLEKDDLVSKEAIYVYFYLLGFLVLGFLGLFVQRKYIELPEEDDDKFDEMKGEDEAKICGCF